MAKEKETLEETLEIEETAKSYTLRALEARDVFAVSRIIGKIGVQNIKKCFGGEDFRAALGDAQKKGEEAFEALGVSVVIDVVGVLVEHLPDCEKELFAFLGSMTGKAAADIAKMPPEEFFDLVVDIVKLPGFSGFFKRALRLFK